MTEKVLDIYRGVPASGKSTEAMKYVEAGNAIRVSRDDIRYGKFGKGWGMDEGLVTRFFEDDMRNAMSAGGRVISDNTNLVAKYVKRQMTIASENGYRVEFHDFPISLNEALDRDEKRERSVGGDVLRSFFRRYIGKDGLSLPPAPKLDDITLLEGFQPYGGHVAGRRNAILVDIDGTLAHHEGIRSPYDTSLYHLDEWDQTVADIAQRYRQAALNNDVIIMSGRESTFRSVLVQWLNRHGWDLDAEYDAIYMRNAGDRRNDAVVKNELFETFIAGRYNIDFVLDDRNRVVNMWRAKGLKVLQVADGDF